MLCEPLGQADTFPKMWEHDPIFPMFPMVPKIHWGTETETETETVFLRSFLGNMNRNNVLEIFLGDGKRKNIPQKCFGEQEHEHCVPQK